jgi:hypothetical protein
MMQPGSLEERLRKVSCPQEIIDAYQNLPLTLPIEDEYVRRVSEVLTMKGCTTVSSCHGHPEGDREPPDIIFETSGLHELNTLGYLLGKSEWPVYVHRWKIETLSVDPYLNPDAGHTPFFVISPRAPTRDVTSDQYQALRTDLDCFGCLVYWKFDEVMTR